MSAVRAIGAAGAILLTGCSLLFDADHYLEDAGARDAAGADARTSDAAIGDGGPTEPAIPIEGVCEELRRAVCAWAVRCRGFTSCNMGPSSFAKQRCEAQMQEVAAGRLDYDPFAAASCVEANRDADCLSGPPIFRAATLCRGTWVPRQRLGDDCYYSSTPLVDSCAEGVCTYSAGACPGVCAPYRALGAACDGAGLACDPSEGYCGHNNVCTALPQLDELCTGPCAAGLSCMQRDDGSVRCTMLQTEGGPCTTLRDCLYPLGCSAGRCAMEVQEGEECHAHSNCSAALRCGQRDMSAAGRTCQSLLAHGAPCIDESLCPTETHCLYDSMTSTPRCLPWATAGESCAVGCEPGLWCARATTEDLGTCQPQLGAGAACADAFGPNYGACRYPLLCMADGRCHGAGSAPGEPCQWSSVGSCAPGLWCEQGTNVCRAPVGDGEACNPLWGEAPCTTGHYCRCGGETCPGTGEEPSPANVCAPVLALGSPCMAPWECESGLCFDPDGTGTMRCSETTVASQCFGPPPAPR